MEEDENTADNKFTHMCEYCDKSYTRRAHLDRHINSEHESYNDIYMCPHCPQSFFRWDKYMRHMKVHSDKKPHSCEICPKKFSRKEHLKRHMENKHSLNSGKIYRCEKCEKSYERGDHLRRHMKSDHRDVAAQSSEGDEEEESICEYCGKTFIRKDKMQRHIKEVHVPEETHKCGECGELLLTKDNLRKHLHNHKMDKARATAPPPKKRRKIEQYYKCNYCGNVNESETALRSHIRTHLDSDDDIVQEGVGLEKALNGAVKVLTFIPKGKQKGDLTIFCSDVKPVIGRCLKKEMLRTRGVRWFLVSSIEFVRTIITEEQKEETATTVGYISCQTSILLPAHNDEDLEKSIGGSIQKLFVNLENFKGLQGTGWQLNEIKFLRLNMGRYKPLRGRGFLPLPKAVQGNKAVLNIQNNDDKCFLWSILAALHPFSHEDHPHRVSKYIPYADELNMEGIEYPVSFSDIPKFVKQNKISVHVIGYEQQTYFPTYQTYPELEKHVNLLLFEKNGDSHYCLIRNVDRMLSAQTKHNGKRKHCSYCFHGFGSDKLLHNHRDYCQNYGHQVVTYPGPKEKEMKFTQIGKMLRVPFVIYADFECILEKMEEGEEDVEDGKKKNRHTPCGYSYLVVSDDENYQPEIVTYSDENVLEHFFDNILRETEKLMEKVKTNKTMIFH